VLSGKHLLTAKTTARIKPVPSMSLDVDHVALYFGKYSATKKYDMRVRVSLDWPNEFDGSRVTGRAPWTN
jgi:hypothetical protein